jgi:prepilin-type processing-associated H-X9-DG protein
MQFRLSTLFLLAVVLWSSLALFGGPWGIVVFIAAVALAVLVLKVDWMRILIIATILFVLIGLLWPAMQSARESGRGPCANNLHQIGLALLNYETANGCFPPAYIADKNGRPMHSWRVLILPCLGHNTLYMRYSFNEPWDGPNNKKLLASRPKEYACPYDLHEDSPNAGQTSYVAVVGRDAAWRGEKPLKSRDFDGAESATIMVVEAADADIPWTKPDDLALDAVVSAGSESFVAPMGRDADHNGFFVSQRVFYGFNAAFADGHIAFLPSAGAEPSMLLNLLRIGGATETAIAKADAAGERSPSRHLEAHVNWSNCIALAIWVGSVCWLFYRAWRGRQNLPSQDAAERAGKRTTKEPEQTDMEQRQ